jgi:hypothetical protein
MPTRRLCPWIMNSFSRLVLASLQNYPSYRKTLEKSKGPNTSTDTVLIHRMHRSQAAIEL